ncbi:MAG: diaminopimelate decarboxylase [Bacteroidota bacterium]|nr:diaminopimelate decarboxylase [Bacteroidota bacterium]
MQGLETKNLKRKKTPFYFYDIDLLRKTLSAAQAEAAKYGFIVHYALKANANERILSEVHSYGFGADCVSGNEVLTAVASGFNPSSVVLAGVGKSDDEIRIALEKDIFCFNCESLQELQVINEIALSMGKTARVALRINPNVDAHTHHYITTGINISKFGIAEGDLAEVMAEIKKLPAVTFVGLHFHVGSQITDLNVFSKLCKAINHIQATYFSGNGFTPQFINVGGGLGVDYEDPFSNPIPPFAQYFDIFHRSLEVRPGQAVHFELGRSLVANSGALISKVLYTKKSSDRNFLILDAGMTELIRPALYQAHHQIQNVSRTMSASDQKYDVVGPICESSDCFGTDIPLPLSQRGDLVAIHSAGAYGEVMSSQYNLRTKVKSYYSDTMGEKIPSTPLVTEQ